MPTNSNSNEDANQHAVPQLYTTCNNCGDIVNHVDIHTDFDYGDEPSWCFTGVSCCGSSVNPCQSVRIGNPRMYALYGDDDLSPWLQYVGRVMNMYGYDTTDDITKVWSGIRNSIQYQDLLDYYTQEGDETNE